MVKTRRQNRTGVKIAMLMAVAAIGLTACDTVKSSGVDPIDWYRDLSGDSKNDVQDKAANSKNLKEGSKEPYPNLASVPKQPDNVITKADRERLARALLADRQNAQYTDQQLRAGQNLQAVAPPAPEAPASARPKVAAAPAPATVPAAASPSAAAPAPTQQTAGVRPAAPRTEKMAAVPVPPPVKQEALPPPNQTAAANPPPAPASAKAAAQPPAQQVAMAPIVDEKDRAQEQATKPKTEQRKQQQATKPKTEERKKQQQVKRGSEPPPEESALRPPSVGAMPIGEEAHSAPPPPEEVAAATPPRSDVDGAKGGGTGRAIQIDFAPGPFKARILPADQNRLAQVAKVAQRDNARIRIVGYGGASGRGDSAEREFQSFNAALDNAKAVGIALAKLGVPANRIDIETKANVDSPDRAEIFVER